MADAETTKSSAPASKAKPPKAASETKRAPVRTERPEDVVVRETAFSTTWYWVTFAISFVSFWILLIYFQGASRWNIVTPYWLAIVLAAGLTIWSVVGLAGRYQLVNRVGASATRRRDRLEVSESEDAEVVYRENVVIRLFKLVGRLIALLFLFVWNTLLRIVYILEVTILRLIILGYDIIYYITYAAWALVFHALRISWAIIHWSLRAAWKILRVLTRLPVARFVWDRKVMPAIMGRWNARMAARGEAADKRRQTKRRLAVAKGKDADEWEADQKRRHHFPLPHPHEARKGLRDRILERQKLDYNRRDRWTAYRKNQPIPPKLHSERRKRRLEEKGRETEQQRPKQGEKGKTKERGRQPVEADGGTQAGKKRAAGEGIADTEPGETPRAKPTKRPKAQPAPED